MICILLEPRIQIAGQVCIIARSPMKGPIDKQGTLPEAEEGKLDNDKHMYTI